MNFSELVFINPTILSICKVTNNISNNAENIKVCFNYVVDHNVSYDIYDILSFTYDYVDNIEFEYLLENLHLITNLQYFEYVEKETTKNGIFFERESSKNGIFFERMSEQFRVSGSLNGEPTHISLSEQTKYIFLPSDNFIVNYKQVRCDSESPNVYIMHDARFNPCYCYHRYENAPDKYSVCDKKIMSMFLFVKEITRTTGTTGNYEDLGDSMKNSRNQERTLTEIMDAMTV